MLTLGPYRNEDIKQALRQLFTSPLVRKYWMSMAPFRRASIVPGSAEAVFTALVDDVFNEHDEPRP